MKNVLNYKARSFVVMLESFKSYKRQYRAKQIMLYEINEISWDFRQKFLSDQHMLQNCLILHFSHKNLQTIIFFHILEYLNYIQLNFDGLNMRGREYRRPDPLFVEIYVHNL